MSSKSGQPPVHGKKTLVECAIPSPEQTVENIDPTVEYCRDEGDTENFENQNRVQGNDLDWLEDATNKKVGIGRENLCDPMQKGQIVNDLSQDNTNKNTIYRYSKSLRGTDEAVMDLFRSVILLDEDGKAHPVPIIWGTQEKAVNAILQDNVRKDETLVVDRIRLPMMAIHSNDISFNQDRFTYHKATDYLRRLREDKKPGFTTNEKFERDTVFGVARGIPVDISYTLYAWTLYLEDMSQILEQIHTKFSPIAYIRVRGVHWEIGVQLDSSANNIDFEPGDQAVRVIKWQFGLTAQSYIPQPITRSKAVLKTKVEMVDGITDEEISEVISRLEEAVEELEC